MLLLTWRHPRDKPLPEPSEALVWWDTCAIMLAEPFKSAFSAAPSKAKIYGETHGMANRQMEFSAG